ncbi:type I methionyl aminopeptidase [candidate division KSB1 bacterium]
MIVLHSENEIELIAESARIVGLILNELEKIIKPGMTTEDIDKKIEEMIYSYGGKPAFKGYRGYPASSCISIDEVVVHGIPGNQVIKEGQIVTIDIGVEKGEYFGDSCKTFKIGDVDSLKEKLVEVTEKAMYIGIEKCLAGGRLHDASHAIQKYVESNGFSVVRDMVGHGIGKQLHMDPPVPHYGKAGTGPELKNGMVFCVEPMVNAGTYEIEILEDKWTAVTIDKKPSAQFEHTIAIINNKPRILSEV